MEAAAGKPGGEEDDEVAAAVEPQQPPPQRQNLPSNGVEPPAHSAMDSYLRSQGLYRKRVAKDGSCLFRAVAEQVFHSQSQHLDIRMACINYLRKNREQFEAFIEGEFEEYLKSLENPQEWVGQVEISALSLMYKKDFIIYQEPNCAPSHVTENGFPDKVLLCFSNGSHYDIVYPIEYTRSAALCQSVLYELLYEKVFNVNVNKIIEELKPLDVTKCGTGDSEASDSEDEDAESETPAPSFSNGLKLPVGKKQLHKHGKANSISLPKNVLRSLNPSVYQNVEYEVWHQSKRDQQKQDFSIAAGMQYSVGDKCQVRLDHNGKFYNAHIQEVLSANGPVVVFVEELSAKHKVLLKNLKALPQAAPLDSWSTVLGKKTKKSAPVHGQNVQTDADCRGSKNPAKPIKTPSTLPPRLQGTRPHHLSSPGTRSEQPSPEHKTPGRNPSQIARKADRERTEELDYTNRDCSYFGLSPEEHKEKQTPSVSQVATQMTDNSGWRRPLIPNGRRASSLKEKKEERKDVEVKQEKASSPEETPLDQKLEPKISKSNGVNIADAGASPPSSQGNTQSPCIEQNLQGSLPEGNPTPSLAFPEMHLPPTVPSVPAIVPAWPSEPTTYGPTGIPSQVPVSSVMPTQATGLDSALSQPQLSSSPVAGIPVSLQAVNQPLMPLSQTLNPYQDPLYPGFPVTEKGERVITPPYSLCSTGEDLPNDKNILRFFFNLGIKAYSCPMWAPHSYLYPLHQAYLTACRMYPKVPVAVYSHNPWMQELPLTQNGNEAAQIDGRFSVQDDVRINGQSPQTDTMPQSMPLFIPAGQVPESQGLVCVESGNPAQSLHAEYDESLGNKSIFLQPTFGGQNPFLGPVPVAPFFPHLWYGYPVQGYVENSAVRQVAVPREDNRADAGLPEEHGSPVPDAGCADSLQKVRNESIVQDIPLLPATAPKSECNAINKTSARVPREQQTVPATPSATQAKSVLQNTSTETKDLKRQMVAVPKTELKNAALTHKEKTDKASDAGSESVSLEESRVPRTREESSEDECEVSNMLKSGRSKQFYNQTYEGGRRSRGDRNYHPGRGGYHYPRNEESWKGPSTRNRDEGYQYHRSHRGRPYRNERRRTNVDGHRGQQLP
ncbi:OTU domain-containing protein 4 isoform X2 [Varanus komodoensis]|uniref:OTU domain-containing protein 4 isoform X2 n=1 Tax=Varanus komodoensis TaxID=61221 RepID=UPI001CF79918|nr:OTU domain-containing protein 4 isoform X2 [Varanus komodoensis]